MGNGVGIDARDGIGVTGGRYVLGVTGGIASGKSSVCEYLRSFGATIIDSDLVYRELVSPGQPLLEELVAHFGDAIQAEDGSLDRPALGSIVFSDPAALDDLDRITHPVVIAEVDRRVDAISSGVVVLDAVKLIESGHGERCDQIWLVITDRDAQVTRLMKRNKLSGAEARRRVGAQPSLAAKRAGADVIIENSGTPQQTYDQVRIAWNVLPVNAIEYPTGR